MPERQRLGDLLVAAGVIDDAQRQQALDEQTRTGRRLGATLLGMEALDEETLTRTLARQLSLPVAWLRDRRVRREVLDLVPRELIEKHRCLPVQRHDRGEPTLLLAMEDPSDVAAIDEIATHTGLAIQPVLAAASELEDAIQRHRPVDPGDSLASAEFLRDDDSGPDLLAMEVRDLDHAEAAPLSPVAAAGQAPPLASPAPALPPSAPPPRPNDLVLRALTQLLVEKGIITRKELIDRLGKLGADDAEG